ncbi:hypothetical protein EVAR_8610_1 [Eumeta japonica]|uniref:Uncharacterized protein n=1 Tax=Eumeta variegata TaxID=151549 RepID=A0A4C1XEC3_EUMVA|nr:hypothetical protein EVAR_8610_1 [Eumeta japonica]
MGMDVLKMTISGPIAVMKIIMDLVHETGHFPIMGSYKDTIKSNLHQVSAPPTMDSYFLTRITSLLYMQMTFVVLSILMAAVALLLLESKLVHGLNTQTHVEGGVSLSQEFFVPLLHYR